MRTLCEGEADASNVLVILETCVMLEIDSSSEAEIVVCLEVRVRWREIFRGTTKYIVQGTLT